MHYNNVGVVSWFYSRWVWAEGGHFPDLEEKLEIGGFGYPVRYQNLTLVYTIVI